MRLLQISDTHFGTERPQVVEALLAAARKLQPHLVVLCGDITQRARRAQFDAARRFMDAMPATAARIAIPGNHDLPLYNLLARFSRPYAGYSRSFGARETLWRRDGVCLLALDATHPRRHKDGALKPGHLRAQLSAARAGGARDDLLIVAAHQPLWTAWDMDCHQTLHGRNTTALLMAEARVDAVLSGHVHVPLLATSGATGLPELSWQFVLSGSGSAVSHRTREGAPNSFNLLLASRRGELLAERHDYVDGGFRPMARARWTRGARGWEARQEASPVSPA